jgi:hypothetical protein
VKIPNPFLILVGGSLILSEVFPENLYKVAYSGFK